MSLISGIQSASLEFGRKTQFDAHSESAIVFQTHDQSQFSLSNVSSNPSIWLINSGDAYGNRLPDSVQFELQIAEGELIASEVDTFVGVKHAGVVYQIIRPSPFKPVGAIRFWRFWLSPQEDAS